MGNSLIVITAMNTKHPPPRGLQLALALILLASVHPAPQQDASTKFGSPFLLSRQATSSSEETSVSIPVEHQGIPRVPGQLDEEIHPFLDVEDLSAEYDYEDNESVESDEDERVRRSLMGRGSSTRGGGRGRGGGGVSRRRDQSQYDYSGGSQYTWTSKRAPMPAPAITNTADTSPSTTTTSKYNDKKAKKEKKKKKSGSRKKEKNGLTKELRQEIAQYALKNGLVAANEQYRGKVGRVIPEKVIDKWVQRLRKKKTKNAS